jgi:FMN hydrolase / 5-amino-6-(5-phospho-D-ribitylamino)uracil phosphatase
MRTIKAVLFDLDDTLWPVIPIIMRAETLLFNWLRIHVPGVAQRHSIESLREERRILLQARPEFALNLEALRRTALMNAFREANEDMAKLEPAMDVFIRARNAVILYDDVLPSLARLKQKVTMGSISNGTADLHAIGLAHYFDVSVAARVFGKAKPDPAIFHVACEALQIAPHEAAYVGDDPLLDVAGAQSAGLHAIWINRSGVEPEQVLPDHIRPDAICTTFLELEQWLDKRQAFTSN